VTSRRLNRLYGYWATLSHRPLDDPRIWRENKQSYELPTQFQRAIGVRYSGPRGSRHPRTHGGYGEFGHGRRPSSLAQALSGFFSPGPVSRLRVRQYLSTTHAMAKATGYVLLSGKALRFRSYRGLAVFVGTVLVKHTSEA
jgi:hypothetical protein